jgi:hypothetical protein
MPEADNKKFVMIASMVALVPLCMLPWAANRLGRDLLWALGGWFLVSLIGVVAGGWVVSQHGTPGNGFLAGLVGGILARMALAVLGIAVASSSGRAAIVAFLAGVVAGFVPVQIFELSWFFRSSVRGSTGGRHLEQR